MGRSFCAAINHLLAREPWARAQLAPYAGKTARLAASPITLDLRVSDDGLLEALPDTAADPVHAVEGSAAAVTPFDVTIRASSDALPAFVQGGQAAAMKHVRIDGDAEFASTIARLAEHLRWEPEEDLAGLIGDAPAHQLAQGARSALDYVRHSGRNLLESLVEYLLDEDPQLVRHASLEQMRDELVTLRDTLARLEKRIDRLDRAVGRTNAPSTKSKSALDAGSPSLSKIDSDDGAAPSGRSR